MTIKVSICNLDYHKEIRVMQCPISRETGHPAGPGTPVWVPPLTAIEFHVHAGLNLEISEVKP